MPTARNRPCALLAALCCLALAGCLTPRTLEPGPEDWNAIVTVDDLALWLEQSRIVLEPDVEKLEKRKIAWSYELSYEFSGAEADGAAHPLRVFLRSEVMVHPNAPSALHNANSYWVGLAAGLRKGGATLERVEPSIDWGDGRDSFTIHKDGQQIGNLFIGHSGRVATYVVLSGLYSSDPSAFERLIEPKLRELEHYDPRAVAGPVAFRR